jgi:hypothetical protein
MVDEPEPVRYDVWRESPGQSGEDGFVLAGRGGRHEQFASDELVLVAVVREAVQLVERPTLGLDRHVHDPSFLGEDLAASMRRRCQLAAEATSSRRRGQDHDRAGTRESRHYFESGAPLRAQSQTLSAPM